MNKKYIRNFLKTADLLISDLDGTLAPSTAFRIVIQNFFQKDFMDPEFYFWTLRSLKKYIEQGKDAYSEGWADYLEALNVDLEKEVNLKLSLYSKVEEFHQLLKEQNPNLRKIIVSETLPNVVESYKNLLEYDEGYSMVKDKGGLVNKVLNEHKKCVVVGDNIKDKLMKDEIKKQGKECFSIFKYILNKDKRKGFDLYFKNWKELVEILK